MGIVYLAEDLKHRRKVAVKVLHPDLAAGLGTERFLTEIELTAKLQHPHITPLFDSGKAGAFLYFVMPYVDGETLRQRLDARGAMPLDSAVDIVSAVASALHYAHSRGVLHRDIKPENIMLSHGHAMVLDFGIGRALSAATGVRFGPSAGTPPYMSPEQLHGEAVDGRSDLYSLGCVFYELLAGEPLFQGKSVQAVLAKRFDTPSAELRLQRRDVPDRLIKVIQRLLERDPEDRYATGCDLSAAIRNARESSSSLSDARVRKIAVLPFVTSNADAETGFLADGITEEILNALAQVPELDVASRTSSFFYKGRQIDVATIGRELGVDSILEGSVRRTGNQLRISVRLIDVTRDQHVWSKRYEREMTDLFSLEDEIATAVAQHLTDALYGSYTIKTSEVRNIRAYELFLQGRALQYQRGYAIERALERFTQAIEIDPGYAEAHAWLGDAHRLLALYGFRRPHEALPLARTAAERALSLDPNIPEAHATLADVSLVYDGEVGRAKAAWDRALELDPGHTRARCEHALRYLCLLHGDMESAISETERARSHDPLNAYAASIHAMVLGLAGWLEQATREARHALEIDGSSFVAHWMSVEIPLWRGDTDAALAAARFALAMSARHPWILAAVAMAHSKRGDRSTAHAIRGELEHRAQHEYIQRFPLAVTAAAAGDLQAAMLYVQEAVRERDPMIMSALRFPEWQVIREQPGFTEAMASLANTPIAIGST